jgi:hypothetical protein
MFLKEYVEYSNNQYKMEFFKMIEELLWIEIDE